jgi:toxin ParE1/3/4
VTPYDVVISAAAESDIEASFLWYRDRNALIAVAFRAEVFAVIDAIAESPLSRPPDDEGSRRRVVHRFPYSVYYEVLDRMVTILAVAHHRRKPGYWAGSGR